MENRRWEFLTDEQKQKYRDYCDKKYGKTYVFCETREPLYFDEDGNLINTKMIIDLLFCVSKN